MLQRIQTLFLLGTFVLSVLLLTGDFSGFVTDSGDWLLGHAGLVDGQGEKLTLDTWPLTVLLVLVSALSFFSIFSYRNRIRQMRIAVFLMFLCSGITGMMFYYIWAVKNTFEVLATQYLWRFVLPPVCILFLYLAFRMIRRDELLVKAFDRIR